MLEKKTLFGLLLIDSKYMFEFRVVKMNSDVQYTVLVIHGVINFVKESCIEKGQGLKSVFLYDIIIVMVIHLS